MGNHTNYYLLILSLIRLKDEFQRIKIPKLHPLIQLLSTKSIHVVDGCEDVPSNKDLAAELDIPITKCNSYLKQILEELVKDFDVYKPLEIDKVIHHVMIMLHYEEWKRAEENKKSDMPDSISFHLQLKETPRIGEYIEFELVPGNRFERGIVHEVRHVIHGKTQIIEIYAHPLDTDYDRWMKLKEKYETHQRWLRQIELSNKRI
ncbi:hypothetical protein AQPE_2173 [Aquipluma nitroreducens]|uniref:Uncharacterized protein n=1 Tax=Aquipluma nitroreducens TaxID=2010828 RepID=A0A5K7S9N6_9BACT|nr:hypothetical protein [Aquipluma nitroreducens]BBE18014.1 hypothetical protein AQPE_2173 [Aquipluma nitroreducens]